MLIVLEGLDGAGKSTQIAMLREHFAILGLQVEYLHFPRFEAPVYGDMIARFLRGDLGSIESVHPMLVALLFAEDRRDASRLLREWLESGKVVILDRYIYSNIAFQCAKIKDKSVAKELRDWIFDLEFEKYGIPVPALNLFLDVPLGFIGKKLSESRDGEEREYLKGKRDIHEADILFQENVREKYIDECEKGEGLVRIDCASINGSMLAPEEIFKKILNLIKTT